MHWACQAMAPHKLLIPCAFIFLKIICPGSTVENTTQPCLIFINLQTFSGEFTHNLVCFTQPPAPKASPPRSLLHFRNFLSGQNRFVHKKRALRRPTAQGSVSCG